MAVDAVKKSLTRLSTTQTADNAFFPSKSDAMSQKEPEMLTVTDQIFQNS